MTQIERQRDTKELLDRLTHELFQTETSAIVHSRREARRLDVAPPAQALRAVADHAARALRDLPAVARAHRLPVSWMGSMVGRLFSAVRQLFADRILDRQKSYRATLLGMRHGVDLVRTLRHTAHLQGELSLEDWCDAWLRERIPLVRDVEDQLLWFAAHSHEAIEHPLILAPPSR